MKKNQKEPTPLSLSKGACIVVFDDDRGLCCPLCWNEEHEGALECGSVPVIFPDRTAARTAINISRKLYALLNAQGKAGNEVFSPEHRKSIKILNVTT